MLGAAETTNNFNLMSPFDSQLNICKGYNMKSINKRESGPKRQWDPSDVGAQSHTMDLKGSSWLIRRAKKRAGKGSLELDVSKVNTSVSGRDREACSTVGPTIQSKKLQKWLEVWVESRVTDSTLILSTRHGSPRVKAIVTSLA